MGWFFYYTFYNKKNVLHFFKKLKCITMFIWIEHWVRLGFLQPLLFSLISVKLKSIDDHFLIGSDKGLSRSFGFVTWDDPS